VISRRKMIATIGGVAGAAIVSPVRAETAADLTIRWTNGATETIPNVAANQLITIREGAGIIGKQKFR
jgi:hypothetical protein